MTRIPISSQVELNKDLEVSGTTLITTCAGPGRRSLPAGRLPGQPRITLAPRASLDVYLDHEHLTPSLDALAPRLWLVSTPRYWHISPLHAQAVRGRNIVLTENPQLHLVWYYDRIFVKPIPRYLLSSAFWQYLDQDPRKTDLRRAIAGFMRTYAHLIRYESDFRLATTKELSLIPTDDGSAISDAATYITFERFVQFITSFEKLSDDAVSPRYTYGELRLTRLNICAKVFLGKLTFHHIDSQWSKFLGRFLGFFLPIFAMVSTALSAMQVELGAQGSLCDTTAQWAAFSYASRWFSCTVLILIATTSLFFLGLLIFLLLHDIWFARSVLQQKRQTNGIASADFKSGVI